MKTIKKITYITLACMVSFILLMTLLTNPLINKESHYDNANFLLQKINLVNLKEFGVKGDGKTDDSEAIQNVITHCEKNSIKTLFVPDGVYLIKKSIIFKKGGIQLIGSGALLREESWIDKGVFPEHQPFGGCTFLIENDISGLVYDKTVADPVRIADIQFITKNGRKNGTSTAIHFKGEFRGPTWPFIIERCNFRGFNYAIKFESPVQYCIAFVQITQSAFSQNDECVYFSDIPSLADTIVGIRNLTWGFNFSNNKAHDNSRVIRGTFAKDLIEIKNNNMEGNIKYANGKAPDYIVDMEISNATVEFEGNHFESTISDCVYISSAFKNLKGGYLPPSGRTTNNSLHKVFIKGNSFDGISGNFKPFTIKGMNVYNYDAYSLFLDECTIAENYSNRNNLMITDYAKKNGSTIKIPALMYEKSFYLTNNQLMNKRNFYSPANEKTFLLYTPLGAYQMTKVSDKGEAIFSVGGTAFFGNEIVFYISYNKNGGITSETVYAHGNYGFINGYNFITGLILNKYGDCTIWCGISLKNLVGNEAFISNNYTLFTLSSENPKWIPYWDEQGVVNSLGTFEKGQHYLDTRGKFNVVVESGTFSNNRALIINAKQKETFFTTNATNVFSPGQYIIVDGVVRKVVNVVENRVYVDTPFPSDLINKSLIFKAPIIKQAYF